MKKQRESRYRRAAFIAAEALGVDPRRSGTERLARDLNPDTVRRHGAKPRVIATVEIVVPPIGPNAKA